ncbi:MAG: hypothetical protein JOY54_14565 [Acidobacteriaceae bacterium]|nr:hypothetical protein [Acidobacteriaceae bacterium]
MTARQMRRAAERSARKATCQPEGLVSAQSSSSPSPDFTWDEHPEVTVARHSAPETPVSEARLAANRANAQLSTGPKTSEGKATSSLNAVKTALTGRTVLLPGDDAGEYADHIARYEEDLEPVGPRECALVQSIADTFWRLQRIPALEMAIYAKGSLEFAGLFESHEPAQRPGLIELHTFLAYERQLRNLHIQEARLRRQLEKDSAELRTLQEERSRREARDLDVAAKLYLAAKQDGKVFHPADHGFEFSIQDIDSYLEGVRAANIACATLKSDRDIALSRLASAA